MGVRGEVRLKQDSWLFETQTSKGKRLHREVQPLGLFFNSVSGQEVV